MEKMFETTSPYMYVYLHDDFTINDSKENKNCIFYINWLFIWW